MSEMTDKEYIKELEEENKKLREDAAEIFIKELVINGNGLDASLQNMPFTRVMAEWGRQMFQQSKTNDWTPNFLTLDFGLAGEEHYTMTIKRAYGEYPEKMAVKYKQQRDALLAALSDCMDWMETLRISGDAGFWEWFGECEYTKSQKLINSIKSDQQAEGEK